MYPHLSHLTRSQLTCLNNYYYTIVIVTHSLIPHHHSFHSLFILIRCTITSLTLRSH